MDELTLLHRVVTETSRVVENVSEPQMANPSPCADWSARDVVNHITGGATMFALSAQQGSVPDDVLGRLTGGDNLGDDAHGAWAAASAKALTPSEGPGCWTRS